METVANWYRDLPGWRRRLLFFVCAPVLVLGLLAAFASEIRRGYSGRD
jgi:hypothetical protein